MTNKYVVVVFFKNGPGVYKVIGANTQNGAEIVAAGWQAQGYDTTVYAVENV